MIPIFVGLVGIAVTVVLHALATTFIVYILRKHAVTLHARFGRKIRPFILCFTAVSLAVKHFVDMVVWAFVYWNFTGKDHFGDFETALYFSSLTYTSLGYGDIVLTGSWRIICGIEAMNGILLFGWSTAILIVLVQRMWIEEDDSATKKVDD